MRFSTNRVLKRVAFIAFAICSTFPALAHDFPPNRDSWPIVSNCFEGGQQPAPLPLRQPAAPMEAQESGLKQLTRSRIASLTSEFEVARDSFISVVDSLAAKSWSQQALTAMTNGFEAWSIQQAQIQSQNASIVSTPSPEVGQTTDIIGDNQLANHSWLPDEYQPYDFAVRDWRFKQFTYRGLSRLRDREAVMLLARPAAQPEVSSNDELAGFEQSSHEEVLCQLTAWVAEIPTYDEMIRQAKEVVGTVRQSLVEQAFEKVASTLNSWEPSQSTKPELYAIFEDGDHELLIPAPTAQRWYDAPQQTMLNRTDELDQARAAKIAGQGLRAVANQLLAWSDLLLEESEQLASAASSKQR